MSRIASVMFAVVAYAIFFATFLYLIAFVGDVAFVPRSVDRGPEAPPALAVAMNVAAIALFGLQHSIMARQGFKRAWTRIVPWHLERSVYVIGASLALMAMFVLWRPIPVIVWDATGTILDLPLWLLFSLGWLVVLLSTFMINHFELFGLEQAWLHMRGRKGPPPELRQPFFYKWVAHPIYAGFLLAFWATPEMTVGHLLFAAGMSVYILIAIGYEERDLRTLFGVRYDEYRAGVGKLIPRFRRRSA